MGFNEGLSDGKAQPGAGVAGAAGKQSEDLAAPICADARAVVADRDGDRSAGGACVNCDGVAFGPCRAALSSRFVTTRVISTTSTSTEGTSSSAIGWTRDSNPELTSLRTPSTRSTSEITVRRGRSTPAWTRLMSSRLVTSPDRRSTWPSTSAARSRTLAGARSRSESARMDDDALMDASGARRSWETAATSTWARRSTSSVNWARSACSRSCARSTASAIWLANRSSDSRSYLSTRAPATTSMPIGRPDATRARSRGSPRGPAPSASGPATSPRRSGSRSRSSWVKGSSADATISSCSPRGSNRATWRALKMSRTLLTIMLSSSSRGLSSTSMPDSSKSSRISMPRQLALARAAFMLATTRATGSITTTYTPRAAQFSVAPT